VALCLGVTVFLFVLTGSAYAAESTVTVNLSDDTISALASEIASALADQPVHLSPDSEVSVTSMPPVSVESSISVDGTLPVDVVAGGGLDSGGIAALIAVCVIAAALVSARAVSKC